MDRNILPFIKVMLHLQLSSSTSLPFKPVKVLFLASSTVSMLQAWLAEHSQQHGASWNAEALLIHTAQHKAGGPTEKDTPNTTQRRLWCEEGRAVAHISSLLVPPLRVVLQQLASIPHPTLDH